MSARRLLAAAAVTGALLLSVAPAAQAVTYPSVPGALACPEFLEAGVAGTCTVTTDPNIPVTLNVTTTGASNATVAGTVSITKTSNGSGVATFSVTPPAGYLGDVNVQAIMGSVGQDATIISVAAFSGETSGGGGGLAFTGSDNTGLMIGSAVLLLSGAGAVALAGRRRASARV